MQSRQGRKDPYMREEFVSAPDQLRTNGGKKAALVFPSGHSGQTRPHYISSHSVQSLMHFDTVN